MDVKHDVITLRVKLGGRAMTDTLIMTELFVAEDDVDLMEDMEEPWGLGDEQEHSPRYQPTIEDITGSHIILPCQFSFPKYYNQKLFFLVVV